MMEHTKRHTGEPRPSPTLTFRDVLAAIRLAQPTDIYVIVDQLQRTFRVPQTLRKLALVITGMFVGRTGLFRLSPRHGAHGQFVIPKAIFILKNGKRPRRS